MAVTTSSSSSHSDAPATATSAFFEISSGALCFGADNNIRHGATQPIQNPALLDFQAGGTIFYHEPQFNYAALNGIWKAYPLFSTEAWTKGQPVAWFAGHVESVPDAFAEAERILQVANKPGERDNATNTNTAETFAGRVLVINRYDWVGYDNRGMIPDDEEQPYENYVSLVDYEQSRQPKTGWYPQHGVRMVVKGEYSFGRFGLTEDQKYVHSFLFFAGDCPLESTHFPGEEDRPIYTPLTPEQRHVKYVADGSYLGFQYLKYLMEEKIPAADSLQGPFGIELVSQQELEKLLQKASPGRSILPQLATEFRQLVNEMLSCWISDLVIIAKECTTKAEFLERAFPEEERKNSVDHHLLKAVTEQQQEQREGLQLSPEAIQSLVGTTTMFWTTGELCAGSSYLLNEVLELGGNCARDNERDVVVPGDLRSAIVHDDDLFAKFGKTKLFYPP